MHAELADVPVRSLVPKPLQSLKSGAEYMEVRGWGALGPPVVWFYIGMVWCGVVAV
jgi:hypothetical protein